MAKSFSQAFSEARKKLGSGKTFTWNGKKYTTDTKEDLSKTNASSKAISSNLKPSAKPSSKTKANPASASRAGMRTSTTSMPKANPAAASRVGTRTSTSPMPKAKPSASSRAGMRTSKSPTETTGSQLAKMTNSERKEYYKKRRGSKS